MTRRRARCSGSSTAHCPHVPTSGVRRPCSRWVRDSHDDVSEENAHTEARDARCLHASEHKQSNFLNSLPGRCAHWAGSKRPRIPDSDVVLFQQLTTVYAAHVPSGFLCLDDRKRDDIKLSSLPKEKNTALPWGCGHIHLRFRKRFRKSQPLLCAHPPVLSHGHKNLLVNDLLLR